MVAPEIKVEGTREKVKKIREEISYPLPFFSQKANFLAVFLAKSRCRKTLNLQIIILQLGKARHTPGRKKAKFPAS